MSPLGPATPWSPFGPLIFPDVSHVPLFLTSTSPVVVLMYVSPSLPAVAGGAFVPLKTSFPSRPFVPSCPSRPFVPFCPSRPGAPCAPSWPFGPLIFPDVSHVPLFLTSTSPVVVLMYVSPFLPAVAVGAFVPLKTSFPSRPFVPSCPSRPFVPF